MKTKEQIEYTTIAHIVGILANMCAAPEKMVMDRLTGFLWDEEEAGQIKAACAGWEAQ